MNAKVITALTALLLGRSLLAADIAGEVRAGDDSPEMSDGGFLEVGLMGKVQRDPGASDRWDEDPSVGLLIAGEYRYKGLFVEAVNGSPDGLNLGYKLWSDDQWTIDLIGLNATTGDLKDMDRNLHATQRVIWLLERDPALTGAGVRITRYFDDYIFQYRLLDDIWYDHGTYSTARLGRSWQYRNWNFHGIVGAEYLDSSYSLRMFGVSAAEATNGFPQYSPGSTVSYEAEVGVTYPVSEHWVFRSTLRHNFFPGAVTDGPLFDDRSATTFLTSFSYVF